MCPRMRLRWFTTTLWKCQGTVHATLAMHTEKVQSLHQAQGSTLWRGMFLFWKFWPTSSHASANMLNIETHNHKEDLRGWQTTLRLFKTAPFQQRKMRMNMAGWTCPPPTHTHTGSLWVACRLYVKTVLECIGQHLAGSTNRDTAMGSDLNQTQTLWITVGKDDAPKLSSTWKNQHSKSTENCVQTKGHSPVECQTVKLGSCMCG